MFLKGITRRSRISPLSGLKLFLMHEVLALFLKAFLFASRLPVSAHIHLMDYFRFAEEKPLQAHLAH